MLRALLAAAALPAAALAQGPAATQPQDAPLPAQVAREILTPEHWGRTFDGLVKQTTERFRAIAAQNGGSADEGLEPAVRKLYEDLLPYGDVIAIYSDVLSKNFSAPELAQLRDFYRSPVGAKVRDRMPDMVQQSLLLGLQRVQAQQAKIDAAVVPHLHAPSTPPPKKQARGKAKAEPPPKD
jgi:hypothetical protein